MKLAAALFMVAVTLAAALAPAPNLVLGDKALHVLAFTLLGFWAVRAGWSAFAVAHALCLFAAAIEIGQAAWTLERSASVVDAAASMLGGGLGILLAHVQRWRALAAGVCACVAAAAAVEISVDAVRPAVTRALIADAWRADVDTGEAREPWPGAPARIAARLEIGGSEVFLADAATRRALAMAPGFWPGKRPGDRGTTIVLGHRNGQFGVLGDLHEGDTVAVETVDGVRREYRVTRREVVLWNDSGLSPHTREEALALVTCWPIGETEPTPWRLIVRAEPVRASEALHASSRSMRSSSVLR